MIMESRISFRMNGRTIDSYELDHTVEYRAEALIHARDKVGFAHVPEEDQSNLSLIHI